MPRKAAEPTTKLLIRLGGWRFEYGFSVAPNTPHWERHFGRLDYLESNALDLRGIVISPKMLRDQPATASLTPSSYLDADERPKSQHQPKLNPNRRIIGEVFAKKRQVRATGRLPSQALAPLIAALAGGGPRFLSLRFTPLRYGSADLLAFQFLRHAYIEEWPDIVRAGAGFISTDEEWGYTEGVT